LYLEKPVIWTNCLQTRKNEVTQIEYIVGN